MNWDLLVYVSFPTHIGNNGTCKRATCGTEVGENSETGGQTPRTAGSDKIISLGQATGSDNFGLLAPIISQNGHSRPSQCQSPGTIITALKPIPNYLVSQYDDRVQPSQPSKLFGHVVCNARGGPGAVGVDKVIGHKYLLSPILQYGASVVCPSSKSVTVLTHDILLDIHPLSLLGSNLQLH